MRAFKTRLERLEKRTIGQTGSRVLHCLLADIKRNGVTGTTKVWRTGVRTPGLNPDCGHLSEFKGKFIIVPDHGSTEEWEKAAEIQQNELLSVASKEAHERARAKAKVENVFKGGEWVRK